MRIVSLLPSATEIICLLGLRDQLVGVTHECDYPQGVSALPVVTRSSIAHMHNSRQIDSAVREALRTSKALYTLDYSLLEKLKPDLLVTQSLCNVCAVDKDDVVVAAQDLSSAPQVINLEPTSLNDVFKTILLVGLTTKRLAEADNAVIKFQVRMEKIRCAVKSKIKKSGRPRVVFLEWIDPLFSSGHWISETIHIAGGEDCFGSPNKPATTIRWEQVLNADPDVLIVACCGYSRDRALADMPMLQRQPGWEELKCVRNKRVFVADGNSYFSRPSPRIVDSAEMLMRMLHSPSEALLF